MRQSIIFLLLFGVIPLSAQTEYMDNIEDAKRGDSSAQNTIGVCYSKGNGVAQDYEEAVRWFRKAAENGNTLAQFNLGLSYDKGEGVDKDMSQAVYWYKKSAKSGNARAQFNLSCCYFQGEGVTKNISKGIELLKKSAEQGYVDAQYALGSCYEDGNGVKKDLNQSAYWYNMAAQQGDIAAMVSIGACYYNGEGVSKNLEMAVSWYRKAAEAGDAGAQSLLGYCYEMGEGVKKNKELAIYWYEKASEQGYYHTNSRLEYLKKDISQDGITNNANVGIISEVDKNIPESKEKDNNIFAIIIGNEEYNYECTVPYAKNDAKVFYTYANKTIGVPIDHIKYVENATYNDIRILVNWLIQAMEVCRSKGKAIVYYAGHGIPNESTMSNYLLPVDGISNDPESAFSLKEIYEKMGSSNAKSIVFFLDACFSGSKREEGMLSAARGVAIKVKPSAPIGNMIVFSAAQGDETAYPYKDKQHGLFTYYLLKKLQESKGEVTLGELSEYLTEEVGRQSFVKNGKIQTPTVNVSTSFQGTWRNLKLRQ